MATVALYLVNETLTYPYISMFIKEKSCPDTRKFSRREKWQHGVVLLIDLHAALGSDQREVTSMRSSRRYVVYSKQELPAQVVVHEGEGE